VSGAKVYLVGTAHFSKESCDDVSLVIQAVQPDIVMVELCKQVNTFLILTLVSFSEHWLPSSLNHLDAFSVH